MESKVENKVVSPCVKIHDFTLVRGGREFNGV